MKPLRLYTHSACTTDVYYSCTNYADCNTNVHELLFGIRIDFHKYLYDCKIHECQHNQLHSETPNASYSLKGLAAEGQWYSKLIYFYY